MLLVVLGVVCGLVLVGVADVLIPTVVAMLIVWAVVGPPHDWTT